MAKLSNPPVLTKFFSVVLTLTPSLPYKIGDPPPQLHVRAKAYKHEHPTHNGTPYSYELLYLKPSGFDNSRNFLNELPEALLAHLEYVFQTASPSDYLRSEDYQYDRGEELREINFQTLNK